MRDTHYVLQEDERRRVLRLESVASTVESGLAEHMATRGDDLCLTEENGEFTIWRKSSIALFAFVDDAQEYVDFKNGAIAARELAHPVKQGELE